MSSALRHTVGRTPYQPVFSNRTVQRMLPGFAVSALGDGMATVAVSWLGIELAPSDSRGIWVALAVSAYTLPSVIGALLLGRFLRHRDPAKLVILSALLRAGALGLIPVLYLTGGLNIGLYVTLLACSSVLHSWGTQACTRSWPERFRRKTTSRVTRSCP